MAMMAMLHPGGSAMTPGQQSQFVYSGGAFQPPTMPPTSSPLLPSSNMPTPDQPYGVPRMSMARPGGGMALPALGQGAFGLNSRACPRRCSTACRRWPKAAGPLGHIVGECGPEIFVPDMRGSIVLIPRRDTGYDAILRAMELGARIQRRRFGMPEEVY